jgi:hypothetical protein
MLDVGSLMAGGWMLEVGGWRLDIGDWVLGILSEDGLYSMIEGEEREGSDDSLQDHGHFRRVSQ